MSIEQALINQAKPHIFAATARNAVRQELSKGCRPDISPLPVALEPVFEPLWKRNGIDEPNDKPNWIVEEPIQKKDLVRLRIWISPDQNFDWNHCELFIKQLQILNARAAFEVVGNSVSIELYFLVSKSEAMILSAVFKGQFDMCELEPLENDPIFGLSPKIWNHFYFNDYYPSPPYSHRFTCPNEIKISPMESLVRILNGINPPAMGFYQVVFQRVSPDHDWHKNVRILLDFEYAVKLQSGQSEIQRHPQQSPSGDLHQMAWEVENKAHNDKPFYASALRIGVMSPDPIQESGLIALSSVAGLFQHGGRPLNFITENDYSGVILPGNAWDIFRTGKAYRPGFLMNSLELSGLVNIPSGRSFDQDRFSLKTLECLPVRSDVLTSGTIIGSSLYAGAVIDVCIPHGMRKKHTHLIGKPGMGKSTAQENMILSDIEDGHGVAVLDPHGDLIERLLCLIPEKHVDRCICFNPGDPEWITIWNPLKPIQGQDTGRLADDLVQAIQSFVLSSGWGDRLEHLLRNMMYSLCEMKNGAFLDLTHLLRNTSNESKRLRQVILDTIDNETVRQFWLQDYDKYRQDDFGPPRNKLSKLMVTNSVALMLSQPESRFNFREIMDNGMILLVDLSGVGSKVRSILGSFIISLFHLAALGRSDTPIHERKQFHIHCDEAHRFMTDSMEDLIAETRKYGVSLSIAHQYLSQFSKSKVDAFSNVGNTIIFNVDNRDASYLIKDLQKKVKVEDIVSQGVGEAIVRIGTEIVRVRTTKPREIPEKNFKNRILETSRRKYCRPAHEIMRGIRNKPNRWNAPVKPVQGPIGRNEDYYFEELD